MPTPRLEIRLDRLAHNARELVRLFGSKGISLTAVTKGVRGSPEVARALLASGIRSLGDSRLANLRRMREAGLQAQYVLTRSPSLSEIKKVVDLADVSLNTESRVIRGLAECAAGLGKVHRVILMVELGDLREGILPIDVDPIIKEALGLECIEVVGIGTNLACFGGVAPTEAKMRRLSSIARTVERDHGLRLQLVSGGNSANYQWFVSTCDTGLVNHLRVGEAILLGCDSLRREPIPDLYADAFTLVAEVIELKIKPSRPYGRIAQDAFGLVPRFEDRGNIRRAILNIGKQDVEPALLRPTVPVDILGASSDHLIVDAHDVPLEVGSEVRFNLGYGALLRAMTSPYVAKEYRRRGALPHRLPRHTTTAGIEVWRPAGTSRPPRRAGHHPQEGPSAQPGTDGSP